MAIIQCPYCGKQVSDKAQICPHCKERLIEEKMVKCSECGNEVSTELETCPYCGAPLKNDNEVQKVEVAKIVPPTVGEKTKKNFLKILAAIALVVGMVFVISSISKKNYTAKWQQYYDNLVVSMLDGAIEAEKTANLIHDVWFNTIYKEADPKTNPYTFKSHLREEKFTSKTSAPSSYFNDDFNESLSVLFSSDLYKESVSKLETNKRDIGKMMAYLSEKIPSGKENAYNAISALYDQYLGMINLAINPSGNLNSYTSNFNNYDNDFLSAYNKAITYMSN